MKLVHLHHLFPLRLLLLTVRLASLRISKKNPLRPSPLALKMRQPRQLLYLTEMPLKAQVR
jgi:hypothetical protein